MAKNNRREVAKRLTQEITKTTDPEILIRLTEQFTNLLPKQRPHYKPAEVPKKKATSESTFVKADYPRSGHWLETLPMGKREYWRLREDVEGTPGYSEKMPQEEWLTLMDNTLERFSDAERAALEAYDPEGDGEWPDEVLS